MPLPPASLMIAVCEQTACVKIIGRANFTASIDLKRLVDELWEHGYNRFMFDLSECMTMDSTFLGILSGMGLKFANCPQGQARIIELLNPNPRIAETLENLGVIQLFKVVTCEPTPTQAFENVAPGQELSRAEMTRNCLEAHQTLMDINPANVSKFKDVAKFLAEDLKKIESEKHSDHL